MWAVTVYCQACGRGAVVQMPVTDPAQWPNCDTCGPTEWFTADQPDDRLYPYMLSHNDKRLLRSLKIAQDV